MERVQTKVVRLDPQRPDPAVLEAAGRALAAGELVVFPTETVYGLGANALDAAAVRKIYGAKGRPADNPLIVHLAGVEALATVALPDPAGRWELLARRFWPGPLTLVLPRGPAVPDVVTAGLDSVAVRVPRHPVALGLLRAAGCPVAAPSANRSGRPSPTRAEHVLADLEGRVAWVLDAGPTAVGLESTVLDLTGEVPTVLRPGGVPVEALLAVVGEVAVHTEPDGTPAGEGDGSWRPRSPGLKYRHYAPQAPVRVLVGSPRAVASAVRRILRERPSARVGLLLSRQALAHLEQGWNGDAPRVAVYCLGDRDRPETVARRLFEGLRSLDEGHPDLIVAEAVEERGIGAAVNNRLRKAAGGQVVRCDEPL